MILDGSLDDVGKAIQYSPNSIFVWNQEISVCLSILRVEWSHDISMIFLGSNWNKTSPINFPISRQMELFSSDFRNFQDGHFR